ncbi:gamma-interferon-inducible lysosomal thiol reductase-like isoform X1 [Macrobrachium nipponense]|uniref:gamma-interferon-inducible lysosomal thiol reductase-like isoform X1 n=1 Tax=Macrobrachium nipponense TaxID=159736 RepID=UPI0030C7FC12
MHKALVFLSCVAAQVLAQDPVKIHLYYETLCPYSIDFVVDQLYPTWTELKDIMEVEMFPFGNARYSPDGEGWAFSCQHGADECKGNMIHACAKDHFKDINLEMDFVNCLLSAGHPASAGPKCASEVGVDWTPLDECISSVEGQDLLHEVALQQEQLSPALYFVPWIIVNDFFSEDQVGECQTDLKKVVCEKYKGTPPPACSAVQKQTRPAPKHPKRSFA